MWRRFAVTLTGAVATMGGAVACGSPDLERTCGNDPALCPTGTSTATVSSSPAPSSSSADASTSTASSSSASPPPASGDCDASLFATAAGPCAPNFASGLNVAWVNYAADIPHPDLATFQVIFQNAYAAGGRVVRWWFHTDGTVTPGYDANGQALPISCSQISDVRSILDTAYAAGVTVNISLWSFDMLNNVTPQANNAMLLTQDTFRQAYIDNVLTPLVTALRGHPGLYSWETFNEPEGMSTGGNWRPFTGQGGTSVPESAIQRTVNWFASAIHDADPSARVTNGTWTFDANANVAGMLNYYSDAELIAAGGKSNGTLDFYEVHYYEGNGVQNSCFLNPASHWNLDKPVIMGEFSAANTDGVDAGDLYTNLFAGGYAGGWAWAYEGQNNNPWPSMQLPMQNLYAAHAADLTCAPTPLPPAVQLGDD